MKKLISLFLIVCVVITSLLPVLTRAEQNYSQLYVFGDSLSDTGNLAAAAGYDLPYPFYMNRISNGPVAIDILAAHLGLSVEPSLYFFGIEAGTNYAVATAQAFGPEIQDFPTQLISFFANHNYVAPSDALYVIFVGGNDVLDTRKTTDDAIATAIVQNAAETIRSSIQSLALSGARHFLLVNAPNAALVPSTLLKAELTNDPELIERSRKYSKMFRNKLHAIEDDLETIPGIEISEFDLFTSFNKIVKKAEDYGFTNSTEGCFDRFTFTFHPDCNYGLNFDQFLFFDETHPTAKVHQLIGDAMYEALTDSETED